MNWCASTETPNPMVYCEQALRQYVHVFLPHLEFFLSVMMTSFHSFVAFHEVSVYPKKELPFFIVFTAGLCSVTALLALMTHRYPERMSEIAKVVRYTNIHHASTHTVKKRTCTLIAASQS